MGGTKWSYSVPCTTHVIFNGEASSLCGIDGTLGMDTMLSKRTHFSHKHLCLLSPGHKGFHTVVGFFCHVHRVQPCLVRTFHSTPSSIAISTRRRVPCIASRGSSSKQRKKKKTRVFLRGQSKGSVSVFPFVPFRSDGSSDQAFQSNPKRREFAKGRFAFCEGESIEADALRFACA